MSELRCGTALRPRLTLLLVVALFVVPILVAWWMAYSQTAREGRHLVNHGRFILPPFDIAADPAAQALRSIPLDPGEWAVVYFTRGACDRQCPVAVETLLTLKSLLGNDATRVRIVRVSDQAAGSPPGLIAIADAKARERLSRVSLAANEQDAPDAGILFLDWRGQVMMFFQETVEPAHVKSDLKRLLRASKIR